MWYAEVKCGERLSSWLQQLQLFELQKAGNAGPGLCVRAVYRRKREVDESDNANLYAAERPSEEISAQATWLES